MIDHACHAGILGDAAQGGGNAGCAGIDHPSHPVKAGLHAHIPGALFIAVVAFARSRILLLCSQGDQHLTGNNFNYLFNFHLVC